MMMWSGSGVPEAARRQESGARANLLQNRVRCHRRAVDDLHDFARIETRGIEQRGDPARYTLAGIERSRCRLVDVELSVGKGQHYVGEGSTHVHSDPCGATRNPPRQLLPLFAKRSDRLAIDINHVAR
jgi:hypothetical protein